MRLSTSPSPRVPWFRRFERCFLVLFLVLVAPQFLAGLLSPSASSLEGVAPVILPTASAWEWSDYVVGGGWWQDDDSMFTDHVRGTSVYCDYSVTDKASLFDIAWSTEADLERLLYVDTERIFASPGIYSIPGWESVNHAIDFLIQSSFRGIRFQVL